MKSLVRVFVVAGIVGLSFGMASDADARCCFLKKLFNRGGDCCCETTCCEPDPCGCGAPADCGCGAPADCGCGGAVSEGTVIIEEGGEPTEATSPSEEMQPVPEPPAVETPAVENPGGDVKPADIPADAAT